ncbi:ribose transport system substrate-binding protein [Saccharothrix saharensis]|uniref:Ribose transport system substrate-binding protein n=1 Tax=Saccharothrix saharensis TaxID=571190 RepID=A0A543JAH5_9PSEU|nr:substrate-binding domain-containing protein [Saccharothrix saharensis]TQM79822.1 ribose transport system substrate-binding protein [Saccharothrix saharensis]
MPPVERGGAAGHHASAASDGSVVQTGRDAVVTVEHHVHPRARPAWGAVPALLLAGGAVVAGVAHVIRGGVPTRAVPACSMPLVAAVVAAPLLIQARRRKGRARQVFLVTSAFEQGYRVAGFAQRMHGVLDRNGLDLVLKGPGTRLRRLGAGVPPASHPRREARLRRRVRRRDRDAQAAGDWLVTHLRRQGERRPHVLIVAGQEYGERQRCCADVLRAALPDVSITVDDRCAFHRSRADDAVRAHVRLLDHRKVRLDAIFCTDDEMALGAVDALRAVGSPFTADTVVVGVDGIVEARNLVDDGTSPLRATVVQDSHRIAESAVHVLERLRDGRRTAKRTIPQPELYHVQ